MQLSRTGRGSDSSEIEPSDPTAWTKGNIPSSEPHHQLDGGQFFRNHTLRPSKPLAECQLCLFHSRGEESIVPNFCKARRQNV